MCTNQYKRQVHTWVSILFLHIFSVRAVFLHMECEYWLFVVLSMFSLCLLPSLFKRLLQRFIKKQFNRKKYNIYCVKSSYGRYTCWAYACWSRYDRIDTNNNKNHAIRIGNICTFFTHSLDKATAQNGLKHDCFSIACGKSRMKFFISLLLSSNLILNVILYWYAEYSNGNRWIE